MSETPGQNPHRERLQSALLAIQKLQARLDASESAKREPIAIVGAGCRIPGGADSPEQFSRLLHEGFDAVSELPSDRFAVVDEMFTRYGNFLKDIGGFDPQFFGISPREAQSLDPQQRLLLEVSWEALEHAGQAPDALAGSKTGVFLGVSVDDYAQFHLRSGDYAHIDAYTCSGAGLCFGAGRLSYILGLHGPCMSLDTACSSALAAIHLACQSLRLGECDLALAGGINLILTPEVAVGMSALHALSPDGRCKAFDASADGFGRGEGCGMVVLKRVSAAVAAGDNILAVIRGSAINHDGPSGGLMVPNGLAQEALLREALSNAGVKPADVHYIEAHGTGTALGDPIELEALGAVLGEGRPADRPLVVGSVKTNIGHPEAASGVVGLIKVAMALQRQEIPPHLHFRQPSPHVPWDRLPIVIPTKPLPWPAGQGRRIAGVSAFGMSGTNVHVVVEEAPAATPKPAFVERPLHLLRLSAKSPVALREMAGQFERHLNGHSNMPLPDICYTANVGRGHFPHRVAVLAATAAEARTGLAAFASGGEAPGVFSRQVERGERPKVAFLFTGQGSQYTGMGRQLYETQPTFRATLDRCDELLRPHLEWPLLSVLFAAPDTPAVLDETAYTQPALFALEYALAQLWRSWGVEPAAVLGYSVGEYVAACVAGVFSLEDGLRLITRRGQLMQALPPGGAMAAVFTDEAAVAAALKPFVSRLAIAAINGPAETVISGESAALETLRETFQTAGVKTQRLTVSHAFHSPLLDPMLDDLAKTAAQIPHAAPRIGLVSNLTGKLLTTTEAGGDYWRRHARQPVQFVAGLETLYAQGVRLFVEVGPRPILSGIGRRVLTDASAMWLPSLRRGHQDWRQMLQSLATLHLHGGRVDWAGFDRDYPRRRLPLPTYPFQRTRFWTPRAAAPAPQLAAVASLHTFLHPLLHKRLSLALREQVFESTLRPGSPRFLTDHRVQGNVVLPATAYLEMVLAAAAEVHGPGSYVLEAVRFDDALVLSEAAGQTVQLALTPEADGEMRFDISRNDAGTWRLLVSGRLRRGSPVEESIALGDIKSRCPHEVGAEEYYDRFQEQGLEYGPAFRGLVRIHKGTWESLGQVELPALLAEDAAAYQCHPALLDAALQVMAAAVDEEFAAGQTYIPVGMERFELHAPLRGKLWSHATVRPTIDRSGVTGDVRISDEAGQVLAEVRGLQVRQVQRDSKALADSVYEVVWRVQDLPATQTIEPHRWLIVGARSGLGLSRLLEATGATWLTSLPAELPPCDGVIYLAHSISTVPEAALEECADVLRIVQAIEASAPRLWLVTCGAQPVTDRDVVALEQAPLWGLGNVIALEHPNLRCVRVDLDPAEGSDFVSALVAELNSDGSEDRVAWRDGRRYVARLVPQRRRDGALPPSQPVRLQQSRPGVLDGLALQPAVLTPPGPGEVTIRVSATGLNFRDVLNALGMYPGEASPLGDECAGTIVAIGPGVTDCAIGDEVVALASGSFSTHVNTSQALVTPRPSQLPPEQAAAIPIAFLTAAYGLRRIARLAPGERVLIHAAAGGVGLAAVRLAQQLGAEIFATAGSPEKRAFLAAQGVPHVLDSRSLDFAKEVRERTSERGVDVVLNSLGSEFIDASLRVLAPQGRFIELGKRDIWTASQVAAVNPTAEYHVFDLGAKMRTEPSVVRTLLAEIVAAIAEGKLASLPIREFARADVVDAFRYMAQARHIGKLVVKGAQPQIRADATYLITGGLGALGLRVATWLVTRGARHLLLLGRSNPNTAALEAVHQLEASGAEVVTAAVDVSREADLAQMFVRMEQSMPPLRGVVHAAGVLDDGVLLQQDRTRFTRVLAPKVAGAWNLHTLTQHQPLDFFVLFSSIVSIAGAASQGSYAAANAFLDGLAHYRRRTGLPALSINWGAWAETGMAAELSSRDRRRWTDQGIVLIPPEQGLQAMEILLAQGATQASVVPINWTKFLRQFVNGHEPRLYAELHRASPPASRVATRSGPAQQQLLQQLKDAIPNKRRPLLAAYIREHAVQVLGLDPAQSVDSKQPLSELGLDSLMAVELRNALGIPLGQTLPVALLYDYPTIDALTDFMAHKIPVFDTAPTEKLAPVNGHIAGLQQAADPQQASSIQQASESEAEALLLKELEALNF